MRHKIGDLVKYNGELQVLFEGLHIVLDVAFRIMTVQNVKTGAVFQTDTETWTKIT
tara:strand:+ start:5743 stop:5910 length:168 start_codon:yes stop_codon:yes gene_type:complete